jgi:HSP20 family molecular chaperone IbpA
MADLERISRPDNFFSSEIRRSRTGVNNVVVLVDLPGLHPNVKLRLDDGLLCIEGERHVERNPREGLWYTERHYGRFMRKLAILREVLESEITASYDNGVLEILFPAPKGGGHSIPIDVKETTHGSTKK